MHIFEDSDSFYKTDNDIIYASNTGNYVKLLKFTNY